MSRRADSRSVRVVREILKSSSFLPLCLFTAQTRTSDSWWFRVYPRWIYSADEGEMSWGGRYEGSVEGGDPKVERRGCDTPPSSAPSLSFSSFSRLLWLAKTILKLCTENRADFPCDLLCRAISFWSPSQGSLAPLQVFPEVANKTPPPRNLKPRRPQLSGQTTLLSRCRTLDPRSRPSSRPSRRTRRTICRPRTTTQGRRRRRRSASARDRSATEAAAWTTSRPTNGLDLGREPRERWLVRGERRDGRTRPRGRPRRPTGRSLGTVRRRKGRLRQEACRTTGRLRPRRERPGRDALPEQRHKPLEARPRSSPSDRSRAGL